MFGKILRGKVLEIRLREVRICIFRDWRKVNPTIGTRVDLEVSVLREWKLCPAVYRAEADSRQSI